MTLRTLLVVGGMSARALWRREPNVVPQLRPLVAALQELTGLTAADGEALRACSKSADDTAREALLRPGRFYLFIAVGLAAYESALVGSPLLPLPSGDDPMGLAHEMAEQVYAMIENNPSGEVTDLPVDFDPFAHGHDPFESAAAAADAAAAAAAGGDDTADAAGSALVQMYPVEELRLIRWQLGTLFAHHAPALREVVLADCAIYAPDDAETPDQADDPAYHDFYHERWLSITVSFTLRALATASLVTSAYWFLSAAVPFARAAAGLRWLCRREATVALTKRLLALEFGNEDEDGEPEVEVELSLAEMLTLYQAQESVALAVLNDEILAAVSAVSPFEASDADFSESSGGLVRHHTEWLRHELEVSSDMGKLFMRNVPLFAALLAEHLTDDDAAEFAKARTEVMALVELATSSGAV